MKQTRKEFDQRLKEERLALLLIGMSNVGKSYWTDKLQREKGFEVLSVDQAIGRELGISTIEEVAQWMGHPFEARYPERETAYLSLEEKIMRRLKVPQGENDVVDSTGSLIYHSQDLLQELKEKFLIVHLEVSESGLKEMEDRFFAAPKPLIWRGMYRPAAGEKPEQTLRRCYPDLLRFRLLRYLQLADVSLSTKAISSATTEQFLETVRLAVGK